MLFYLFQILAGSYILLLLVRFLLSGSPFDNRTVLAPAIASLSNWLVLPIGKLVPRIKGKECAALVASVLVMMIFELVKLELRGFSIVQPQIMIPLVLIIALLAVLDRFIQLAMIIIVIAVVASWLRLGGPLILIISYFSDRLLAPLRNFIRPFAGLDLSPIIAFLVGQLLLFAISDALRSISLIL